MSDRMDFAGIDEVVADDLRFRLKLAIGEDAYGSIRSARVLQELWDLGGVAATGAGVAASNTVATTFFAGSKILALIGIGAATPVGWIIAAGVGSAGAYWGVMRLAGRYGASRVRKIPEFINTPIDLLGAILVDMMGTLAVKVAAVDGRIAPEERELIATNFVEEWGIAADYAKAAIDAIAADHEKVSLKDAATALGTQLRNNPDCNAAAIRAELLSHLGDLVAVDGHIDEREEMALERIDAILRNETSPSMWRSIRSVGSTFSDAARAAGRGVEHTLGAARTRFLRPLNGQAVSPANDLRNDDQA